MWTKEITDMIINGVWATLYMTSCWTELWFHCNHCSTCYCGDSIYWTNGRIFY